jgi:hypothetical protein
VLGLLSFYLFLIVWTFVYRYLYLGRWLARERASMEHLHMGAGRVTQQSILFPCLKESRVNDRLLQMCEYAATREATKGLTLLSLVASTSPFIGLFGTVISILEAFAGLGERKSATLSVVAPAISEALVATAAGIFVAVFAYSFHLMLKRRAYELTTVVAMEKDLMLGHHRGGDA